MNGQMMVINTYCGFRMSGLDSAPIYKITMDIIVYALIRRLLFLLPTETSHHVALTSLSVAYKTGLLAFFSPTIASQPKQVMGLTFPNAVGLAAGLDKNADYIDALGQLGFGFIEVGTVTPRAQSGNEKPRLFRLPAVGGIINRMGFNNKGVDYLVEQVKKTNYQGIIGINIGKNLDTAVEDAVDDYLICLRKVYAYADYVTINISSPNTPGLRSLQTGDELGRFLSQLKQEQQRLAEEQQRYVPLAVKVSPDLSDAEIEDMATALKANNIDALIATNTTLARDNVVGLKHATEQGGLSGKPVKAMSTTVIEKFKNHLKNQVPIVGVGGIASAADVTEKIAAGADLVQIYTGFIYQGSTLIAQSVRASNG